MESCQEKWHVHIVALVTFRHILCLFDPISNLSKKNQERPGTSIALRVYVPVSEHQPVN